MGKKLIEVALPLDAINKAAAREKSIRHGHPSTLHLWWARRPLAAARAVLFAQMVDDPSGYVDVLLSDPAKRRAARHQLKKRGGHEDDRQALRDIAADRERERLFEILRELVLWETPLTRKCSEERGPRSGRAGAGPAPRTRIIPAPPSCSTASGFRRSTIRSPGAGRSRWRPSGWGWRPTPPT